MSLLPPATGPRPHPPWRGPRAALLLATLLALLSSPAPARPEAWVLVNGGAYLPTATQAGVPWEAAIASGLAAGYDGEHVGAGLSLWYLPTRAPPAASSATPLLATLRLRLPLGWAVPYAFGSAGVAFTRTNVGSAQYTDAAFAGMAGLGLDFPLGEFTLGAEGGWLWLRPAYPVGTQDLGGALLTGHFAIRF